MPTLHTTTYTRVFSGQNVSPSFPQYNSFNITGNIQLAWAASFQNLNPVVAVNMDITASAGGFTVMMPDAEGAGAGYAITINNPGAFSFNLIDNLSNLIVAIPSGTTKQIWLIDNSTQGGIWRTFPNPGGGSAVTSVNAASGTSNLVITGTPGLPIINAGTINFNLANDLLALTQFGASAGVAVRTAANTWALRSINGTAGQILVANPQGIAGNITISLSNVLTNLVSIGVGNLSLSANTISSTNANGPIILSPQGTGLIQLSNNTQLLSGSSLKYFNTGNNFYVSFKTGTTSVNQDLIWPTTAPGNGQVLQHGSLGQLQWATVPTTGGVTTLNSVARYSNTGGALTDSVVILDGVGNLTGINSAQINNILLGTVGNSTISTQLTNQDLTFSPNGLGFTISKTDFLIRRNVASQSKLRLYNDADNFYAGIMSNPNMIASYTWQWPIAGNVAGFLFTDATNVMSITPMASFFPPASTLNAVPRFANTTGAPLKDSLFVITDAGAGSGLISQTIGNLSFNVNANTIESSVGLTLKSGSTAGTTINSVTNGPISITTTGTGLISLNSANGISIVNTNGFLNLTAGVGFTLSGSLASTVSTTAASLTISTVTSGTLALSSAGDMTLASAGANSITANNDLNIKPASPGTARKINFFNAATTFSTSIVSGVTLASFTLTLPTALSANTGIMKVDATGAMSISALGTLAGNLRTDGAGAITINNITTAANQVAKYSDTVGTTAPSTMYLDASSNLSIGDTTIPGGGATSSATFVVGTAATSIAASHGTLQARDTGAGIVPSWYGAGNGGVSASVLPNSMTNKISVYINGTRYYLLASTNAT